MNDLLEVPGARLFWRIQGAGPTLLLIGGGVYDADAFEPIAGYLADSFTVVTYDRRGNSRSSQGVPHEPQDISVHADDARRVLVAAGVSADSPAAVFGNSSGASIALELATQLPDLIHTVIAHEPPIFTLLEDRGALLSLLNQVEAAVRQDGPGAAMHLFSEGLIAAARGQASPGDDRMPGGGEVAAGDVPPEVAEMMQRMEANAEFFIASEAPYFSRYEPNLALLSDLGVRLIPAAGATSAGEVPHRCAVALAERLGRQIELFPGDHGGFGSHPESFATTLKTVAAHAEQPTTS